MTTATEWHQDLASTSKGGWTVPTQTTPVFPSFWLFLSALIRSYPTLLEKVKATLRNGIPTISIFFPWRFLTDSISQPPLVKVTGQGNRTQQIRLCFSKTTIQHIFQTQTQFFLEFLLTLLINMLHVVHSIWTVRDVCHMHLHQLEMERSCHGH